MRAVGSSTLFLVVAVALRPAQESTEQRPRKILGNEKLLKGFAPYLAAPGEKPGVYTLSAESFGASIGRKFTMESSLKRMIELKLWTEAGKRPPIADIN